MSYLRCWTSIKQLFPMVSQNEIQANSEMSPLLRNHLVIWVVHGLASEPGFRTQSCQLDLSLSKAKILRHKLSLPLN